MGRVATGYVVTVSEPREDRVIATSGRQNYLAIPPESAILPP